jgi:16S rRNA (adenine1518-N6/adenine1519-N6)-dimethyltransferase
MSLFSKLQSLMINYRFRPNEKLSQNFCIDERLLVKMVDSAFLKKNDVVLEIGAGTGFLTEKLLEKCKVIAVEKDDTLADLLSKNFSNNKNFVLAHNDFLDLKTLKFNKIVALPPYALSDDIMLKIFSYRPEIVVIVFQREFVRKLAAFPGLKEYSYLSVLTNLIFDSNVLIENISPMSFFPKPSSYSSLLCLVLRKKQPEVKNFFDFIFFLKQIFRFKNKSLRNAINNAYPELHKKFKIDPNKIDELLGSCYYASKKVNLLEPEEFLDLFRKIFQE